MPDYLIKARATDSSARDSLITTQDKSRAIRYAALFLATPTAWTDVRVEVGGKEYSGPDLRSRLP